MIASIRHTIGRIPGVIPAYWALQPVRERLLAARQGLEGRTPWLDYEVRQRPRWGHGLPPHRGLYELIDGGRDRYAVLAQTIVGQPGLSSIRLEEPPGRAIPRWNQDMLPAIDAATLYTLVCSLQPRLHLEVGS